MKFYGQPMAQKIALDSSVVVDLFSKSSDRHAVTMRCCAAHRAAGDEFVLAEHAILESFSVLSRSPAHIGMPPRDALDALFAAFGNSAIAPIHHGLAWESIRHTLARGHWGGRVYDTIIALAVFKAGASVLLTWNLRHFLTIAPAGLEVREPS
jgi:predicted nucleic acid-binding protein